jgi:hypothetical protein
MKNQDSNTEKPCTIDSVIASDDFLKKLKEAIEYGKGTDWGYYGEDEYEFDTFNSEESLAEVVKLLKSHLL